MKGIDRYTDVDADVGIGIDREHIMITGFNI